MSATADKRVPVSGGKDVSFADRGVSTANNNLPPDFLLGHSDKLIPEPYPGSGDAMRPASRVPTVTYIETDVIICNLPDTKKPFLRTIAIRYHSVNPRPLLISNI